MFEGAIESLPIALLLFFVSPVWSLIFTCTVVVHHFLWNLIHLEMHKPEQRFFCKWEIYKFLARHHMLHHKYPSKNLNVVFPFADYILGTVVRPTYSDLAEFYRIGLLPRQ